MSMSVFGVLLALHVLAAAFWLGVTLFNAVFLIPSITAAGPAGGQVMRQLVQVRRLPTYMNLAVLVTIATGFVLYWWVSAGFAAVWITSRLGISVTLGAAMALVAAAIGQFINAPTAAALGQLGAAIQASGGPPAAEQTAEGQRLRERLARATELEAVLLVIAIVSMVVGRYF